MKKNRKKIISLLLAVTLVMGIRHSYHKFMKNHPEKFYNINTDNIISMVDDDQFEVTGIIPDLDSFVPQGIDVGTNYIFISLYDCMRKDNSCIYVLDHSFNVINVCSLNNYSHVGGIAVDDENGFLWVSGTHGSVLCYSLEDIVSSDSANSVYSNDDVGSNLINYKGQKAVSYLSVYGGKLYIGNYTCVSDGTLKCYDIEYGEEINLVYDKKYNVPTMVQGVAFYEANNQKYIAFSRSGGEDINSFIQLFKFDDKFDYTKNSSIAFKTASMLEQIDIDSFGNLYGVFEFNASPYNKGNINNDIKGFSLINTIKKSDN